MNDRAALPLGTVAFAELMAPFEPFEGRPSLAVAVSGGRDSLALALLARDWAAARAGRMVGLIVDHGLRPESATEAAVTLDVLARQGCEAAVLRWSGAKPRAGLQEAARTARYGLLRQQCLERGILHLLLGHQADDQAETVTMRAARQSGADGLAGMAAVVEQSEVRLLRPLLGVPRARLTATLLARDVDWLDDPSNSDPRFERARLRSSAHLRSSDCVVPLAPLPEGPRNRAGRERRLAGAALEAIVFGADGGLAIDRSAFERLEGELQIKLLSRVIQAVGGGDHPPRRERLQRAVGRLAAPPAPGKSGRGQDFTLAECKLMLRQSRESQRLWWIIHAEHGRKERRNRPQPLVPAAFFACGASLASHVE